MTDWVFFPPHLQEGVHGTAGTPCSSPSHHPWDRHRIFAVHTRTQNEEAIDAVRLIVRQKIANTEGDAVRELEGESALTPMSRWEILHLFPLYFQESQKFTHTLKVLLIDGVEIRSLWYMHRAGLSDGRGGGRERQ